MFSRDHRTATVGEEILPLEVGYVPDFFKRKGEVELQYTSYVREKSLRELKEIIENDDKLSKIKFTDEVLLVFLNSRKYDLNRTVLQIKKYLYYKNDAMYMFTNVTFEELLPCLTSDLLMPLPLRCQDGCSIGLLKLGNWDPEKHPIVRFKKMFLIVLTQMLLNPMTQINGIKAIVDLNVNPNVLRIATPQNLYHLYSGTEKVLPARVKGYHLVNVGVTGKTVWHIMKMFLSEKVKQRVHVHKSTETLLNYFPKAVLPVEYGGDLKDYDMTDWLRKMTSPEKLKVFNIITN